ncbi:MAG: radical SAM protein [Planctomycetes bacterium]|nr:radical SAM protein [Planctomycetota bacterium]
MARSEMERVETLTDEGDGVPAAPLARELRLLEPCAEHVAEEVRASGDNGHGAGQRRVTQPSPGVAERGPGVRHTPQHSGALHRPSDEIRRPAVTADSAETELEAYKLSLRKYAPVQRGVAGLPWPGQFHCTKCDDTVPGRFCYEAGQDRIYLEFDCPTCGHYRQRCHDVLFVKNQPGRRRRRQPRRTHSGSPIRPVLRELPRTVETLCPECGCNILGRYYVKDDAVLIDKTCPEHGYFRDRINSDLSLYLRGPRFSFEDERGVHTPQIHGAHSCPSDCGLCNQHISASCLAQIDLTNRCNLTCPVCFANANAAGYVAEPPYEMVVEMLRALRKQQPYPATAIQFTGGEPTLHPDFFRIVKRANEMGFSHVQAATNGIALAEREYAQRAAEAGLHTLYLQFDGLNDDMYRRLRAQPLLEKKLRCVENCRELDIKICLVPTIVKTVNDDQVTPIFRFAVENADVISAISYQPVAFTGRIKRQELERKRYTLGDLAHDLARGSGADPHRDFYPLSFIAPLGRILQTLDGKPKIRPSCHSDCAFGTYFFVTPEREAVPIPKLFDMPTLFGGFNELAARINRTRPDGMANLRDKLDLALIFLRSYQWRQRDFRVTPLTFMHALKGMTNKHVGRGETGRKTYRTLMAAGMHFMDRYNFDVERIRRCVIQYSTPDGIYPFCAINGGPTYRPLIEKALASAADGCPHKTAPRS